MEERIEKNADLLVSESFLMHLVFYVDLGETTGEFSRKMKHTAYFSEMHCPM
jgi:hypothetical protein